MRARVGVMLWAWEKWENGLVLALVLVGVAHEDVLGLFR
jgi:hypothetical protein